jgi:aminoglycoside phosphotransferase (APT) family kinase protein
MHAASVGPGLPSQRERLEWKIGEAEALPDDLRRAALESLAHMPEGDALCHGDFHPENVLMGKKGPVIIDWIDATCGNPLADVARTSLILSEATRPDSSAPRWLKTLGRWLHGWYCARYFRLRPDRRDELSRWRPIVAAARLSENIEGSREWLLSLAETAQA